MTKYPLMHCKIGRLFYVSLFFAYSSAANTCISFGPIVFLFVAPVIFYGGGLEDQTNPATFGMDLAQSPFDVSRSWHGAFYGNLLLGKFILLTTLG